MSYVSIGDLSRNFHSSRQIGQAKQQIELFSKELATGRKSDREVTAAGDAGPLIEIERAMRSIAAHGTSASEAGTFSDVMQTALEAVSTEAGSLGPALLVAGNSGNATMNAAISIDALARFEAVIGYLNTTGAGRYGFSGMATDQPALADIDVIMADIAQATSGLNDVPSVLAAVDAWFDTPGGGYETIGYTGSTSALAEMRISPQEKVRIDLTALDPGIRETLKGFALAALAEMGQFSADPSERANLMQAAGERMMGAVNDLTEVQASLGVVQERIAAAQARMAAEESALGMTRANLVAADPYETATRLQAAADQLDTIFAVTARLARLSLLEHLR